MNNDGNIFSTCVTLIIVGCFGYFMAHLVDKVFLDSSPQAEAEGGPAFYHDFDQAVAAAQSTRRPIVAVFSASWCGSCQLMKKEVYPSPEVMQVQNRFVWVYLDVDQSSTQPISQRYPSQYIPYIAVLSSDGNSKINEQVGPSPPAEFANFLQQSIR